jgi:predicted dithiol-disulfide oxidoreductase (DUF899 family)
MSIRFPNESTEYRAARDYLLVQEIELRRAMESVAAARRNLPSGGLVPQDYAFDGLGSGGTPAKFKLSELFSPGKDSLVIYNFMFPRFPRDGRLGPTTGATAQLKREDGPCPSCTACLAQLDGAAQHVTQKVNFVVLANAPIDRLITFARERGWRHLRLFSSGGNSFKRDYHAETAEGHQMPMLTVFHRKPDGIHHFWSSEMFYEPADPGEDPRHTGTLEPLWNIFDLTPEGRPSDWEEQIDYAAASGQR